MGWSDWTPQTESLQAHRPSLQDIASMVSAYAKLGILSVRLMEAMAEQALRPELLTEFNATSIANMLCTAMPAGGGGWHAPPPKECLTQTQRGTQI